MDCAWDGQRYLLAVGKTLNRIDRSTQRAQRIRYKSDVISVAAISPNETICGLRNGELHLHDWRGRAEPARPVHVFSKSVNRLWRLGEGSMFIISTMFSQLFLYDIRRKMFMSSLRGNKNGNVVKLPFTVVGGASDAHLCIVGEDAVLRTWSLRTSELRGARACRNTTCINGSESRMIICRYKSLECLSI